MTLWRETFGTVLVTPKVRGFKLPSALIMGKGKVRKACRVCYESGYNLYNLIFERNLEDHYQTANIRHNQKKERIPLHDVNLDPKGYPLDDKGNVITTIPKYKQPTLSFSKLNVKTPKAGIKSNKSSGQTLTKTGRRKRHRPPSTASSKRESKIRKTESQLTLSDYKNKINELQTITIDDIKDDMDDSMKIKYYNK